MIFLEIHFDSCKKDVKRLERGLVENLAAHAT